MEKFQLQFPVAFCEWITELSPDICFLYCSFLSPGLSLLQRFSCSIPSTISCLPCLPQFALHPYHPLCLHLPGFLASLSLSPSQLDSCGTDWARGSNPHQRPSVVECEQATEAPISHWLMSPPTPPLLFFLTPLTPYPPPSSSKLINSSFSFSVFSSFLPSSPSLSTLHSIFT